MLFLDEAGPTRMQALGLFLREFWLVLLVLAAAFAAVYVLLPQVRRSRPAWAAALGIAVCVVGLALLMHREVVFAETVLFYGFALLAILGGGMLVTQHNPVYAALSFALVVLSTCGLFLLQAAPFLMAATIIIYAGAIVVTFLFVIMLAQQGGRSGADLRSREPLLASAAGFVFLAALLCVLQRTYDRPEARELADLADKLERVARAETADDVHAVMGSPDRPAGKLTNPLVDGLRAYVDSVAADNLEGRWSRLRPGAPAEQVREVRDSARVALKEVQAQYRLYGLGGPPRGWESDVPAVKPALPAANVAALGRTLFTDYLVPVELAAVLLLVATIGAIAIAGRRSEELR